MDGRDADLVLDGIPIRPSTKGKVHIHDIWLRGILRSCPKKAVLS
jgi:hypothetical protein